ncbi:MAG: nicotinate (nicotinamide) nucleotide adenylyltransferase [Candidatus Krumholzibacteriia bacterium]
MIRALFGGSFDPIHAGHLALVRRLLEDGLADGVVVVPAGRHPLRPEAAAPGADRAAMARLAFAGWPRVRVDDREVARARDGEPTYTVDTLAELQAEEPQARWRLVVGADNLPDLPRWRDLPRLLELATLVVVAREGWDGVLPPQVTAAADAAGSESAPVVLSVGDFRHPASATEIRRRLAAGDPPGPHLPAAVAAYIGERGLYRAAAGGGGDT